MATPAKAPTGVMLMLKSLGVDPAMFDQMAGGVKAVVASLQRIEEKQDKILVRLDELELKGKGVTHV